MSTPNTMPAQPGIFPTRTPAGQLLYRRFDGRRWHYGDKFPSNLELFRKPLPPGMASAVIASWGPDGKA